MNQIKLARAIAMAAHIDQRYGERPYIQHPEGVAAYLNDDDEIAAAWLHDVLEDTSITVDDLRWAGISEAVIDTVVTLTRDEDESYESYIDRIAQNGSATRIKLADLHYNLFHNPKPKHRERYEKAVKRLTPLPALRGERKEKDER